MIPLKIKEHLDNYIHQEVYVQIAVIKGKEKISTKAAIESYFNSNHFRDLSEGRPYDHFIDGLNDKCLIKLINSPMKDKETEDEVIKELEQERDQMIESLDLKNKGNVYKVLIDFCKKYEELCINKYPDAPLPLEILKSIN